MRIFVAAVRFVVQCCMGAETIYQAPGRQQGICKRQQPCVCLAQPRRGTRSPLCTFVSAHDAIDNAAHKHGVLR